MLLMVCRCGTARSQTGADCSSPTGDRANGGAKGSWILHRTSIAKNRLGSAPRRLNLVAYPVFVDVVEDDVVAEARPVGHGDIAVPVQPVAGLAQITEGRIDIEAGRHEALFVIFGRILGGCAQHLEIG